jgi:hypothetical protein
LHAFLESARELFLESLVVLPSLWCLHCLVCQINNL